MSATRCGSYPLMNIAADFGVDYGDVLFIAGEWRSAKLGETLAVPRRQQYIAAGCRAVQVMGGSQDRLDELIKRIADHAHARWGSSVAPADLGPKLDQ